MEEELRNQIKLVNLFSRDHNGCNYVIILSDQDFQCLDLSSKMLNLSFMSDEVFKKKNRGRSIEDMGNAAYDFQENNLYIHLTYHHSEYTLSRTLFHEYGHYLQHSIHRANSVTCNLILLEYHNILFNENMNCRDKSCTGEHITIIDIADRGFRVSYINKYTTKPYDLDYTLFFNGDYSNFEDNILHYVGIDIYFTRIDKILLEEMFELLRRNYSSPSGVMKETNLLLFANFLKSLKQYISNR